MQASKVTINENAIEYYKGMTLKKRKRLQEARIKEYIQSRPYMAPIKNIEFAQALGLKSDVGAFNLLARMIKNNKIVRHEIPGSRSYAYVVHGDIRTVKKPEPTKEATVAPKQSQQLIPAKTEKTLEDYAKEFAWRKNSDSVRDFVSWMNEKELDLRRFRV